MCDVWVKYLFVSCFVFCFQLFMDYCPGSSCLHSNHNNINRPLMGWLYTTPYQLADLLTTPKKAVGLPVAPDKHIFQSCYSNLNKVYLFFFFFFSFEYAYSNIVFLHYWFQMSLFTCSRSLVDVWVSLWTGMSKANSSSSHTTAHTQRWEREFCSLYLSGFHTDFC